MLDVQLRETQTKAFAQPARVEVYGTRWCASSQALRRRLDRQGVRYAYHDLEREPRAAQQVEWWTGGDTLHPTLRVAGEVLVTPTWGEVEGALERAGIGLAAAA